MLKLAQSFMYALMVLDRRLGREFRLVMRLVEKERIRAENLLEGLILDLVALRLRIWSLLQLKHRSSQHVVLIPQG